MGFIKNIISKIRENKPKRQERRKNRRLKRKTRKANKMRLRKLRGDFPDLDESNILPTKSQKSLPQI